MHDTLSPATNSCTHTRPPAAFQLLAHHFSATVIAAEQPDLFGLSHTTNGRGDSSAHVMWSN